MPCACRERRVAIGKAAAAVVRGDVKAVADQARFVVRSSVEDATSLLRQKTMLARQRLMRR
jgi:hypothetical protein